MAKGTNEEKAHQSPIQNLVAKADALLLAPSFHGLVAKGRMQAESLLEGAKVTLRLISLMSMIASGGARNAKLGAMSNSRNAVTVALGRWIVLIHPGGVSKRLNRLTHEPRSIKLRQLQLTLGLESVVPGVDMVTLETHFVLNEHYAGSASRGAMIALGLMHVVGIIEIRV